MLFIFEGGEVVTLQEILNMISMKFPHYYGANEIITMVNDVQRRIFRTMYKPVITSTFDLLTDNPAYPICFPPESIVSVVVNGEEYPYQNVKYDEFDRYYYILDDNSIGIFPTPTADVTSGLTVFHYKDPATLLDLDDVPDLDPAWHMLIVYHVCKNLAVMAKDDRATAFTVEINELEWEFRQSRAARPHRIKDVYGIRGCVI